MITRSKKANNNMDTDEDLVTQQAAFARRSLISRSPERPIRSASAPISLSPLRPSPNDTFSNNSTADTTIINCSLCDQPISAAVIDICECFKCHVPVHTACVVAACGSSLLTSDIVQTIADSKCPLIYACTACKRSLISTSRPNDSTLQHQLEITHLQGTIDELTAKLGAEKTYRRQKEAANLSFVDTNEAFISNIQSQFNQINVKLASIAGKLALLPEPNAIAKEVSSPVRTTLDEALFESTHSSSFTTTSLPKIINLTEDRDMTISHIGKPVGAGGATKKQAPKKSNKSNQTTTTLAPPANMSKPQRQAASNSKPSSSKHVNISAQNSQTKTVKIAKPQPVSKSALKSAIAMSYAQILAQSTSEHECTLHVKLTGAPDKTLLERIRNDPSLASSSTLQIIEKDDNFLSITCSSKQDANKILPKLARNFSGNAKIAKAAPVIPQIKLINLPVDTDQGTLKTALISQNSTLSQADFVVSRVYTIDTGKRSYSNAILDCSLPTQTAILSLNFLMFAGRKRFVHEYVNVLQCTKCLCFGHMSSNCTSPVVCRKCAESHEVSDCTATHFACSNCIAHNKGARNKFLTDHLATSDKCQSRLKRINGLKVFFANPKN